MSEIEALRDVVGEYPDTAREIADELACEAMRAMVSRDALRGVLPPGATWRSDARGRIMRALAGVLLERLGALAGSREEQAK